MIPRRVDWIYLGACLLLVGLGLLSLWTLAPPTNLDNQSITKSSFTRQLVFLGVSLAAMGVTMLPNYLHLRKVAYLPYAVFLVMLAALLVLGRYTRGARGWFSLGPVNVQPAEFMKIAVVLAMARWMTYARDLHQWRGLAGPLLLAGLPAAVIFLQPDLGTAMLFAPVCLVMLYTAGARPRNLAILVAVALALVPIAYRFGMKDYQRARLTSFLWPDQVPRELTWQQEQSKKACAAGGALGRGLGESGEWLPFYVPDRHTDFVYSVVAEELGFAGATFVLLLFGALFWRGAAIAARAIDPFGRLVVVGLTTFMALQVFINVGMTIGVAPITGLTLPFVSYGGSSLLTCFLSAGLVLNVASRWVPSFAGRDLDRGHREIREFVPQPVKWLVH